MSDVELRESKVERGPGPDRSGAPPLSDIRPTTSLRIVPFLLTLAGLIVAGGLSWAMWQAYMAAPWTRDGRVRVYVVTIAPEVAGKIVQLPIADNQLVHKGDLLMAIDPRDYSIAVARAEAAVEQARANADNAQREARRRAELTSFEASVEEKQTYATTAQSAEAAYQQALANLAQARVNLERATIRSPVNGYVTNLLAQLGDYTNVGQSTISLVDSDSFWVDGYFEETNLHGIRVGDQAAIKLMGHREILRGHVGSIARGIVVANAEPGQSGLANVNPIFTWVRLAQRIPVRIHIDHVPDGVILVAGQTATVQIEPRRD
jgi:RND family efflux transporter MFP subunit